MCKGVETSDETGLSPNLGTKSDLFDNPSSPRSESEIVRGKTEMLCETGLNSDSGTKSNLIQDFSSPAIISVGSGVEMNFVYLTTEYEQLISSKALKATGSGRLGETEDDVNGENRRIRSPRRSYYYESENFAQRSADG